MSPALSDPWLDAALAETPDAAAGVDGYLFRYEPPVRCWVTADRQVVMEIEGRIWDADTLAMSMALGMEVGSWWKHAVRVQRYLAAAPGLDPEAVARAASGSAASRRGHALDRPDLAVMYATDPISRVRVAAATATRDPALLNRLAGDRGSLVREAVAANRHTGTGDLVTLASDEHPNVRARVAANPNCPTATLGVLAADRRATVRLAAVEAATATQHTDLDGSYMLDGERPPGRPPRRPGDLSPKEPPWRPRPPRR